MREDISKAQFESRIRNAVMRREPCLAYWYPCGHGLLRTGPLEIKNRETGRTTTYCASKRTVGLWWRLIRQQQKRTYSLVIVDYDGENLTTEGDIRL